MASPIRTDSHEQRSPDQQHHPNDPFDSPSRSPIYLPFYPPMHMPSPAHTLLTTATAPYWYPSPDRTTFMLVCQPPSNVHATGAPCITTLESGDGVEIRAWFPTAGGGTAADSQSFTDGETATYGLLEERVGDGDGDEQSAMSCSDVALLGSDLNDMAVADSDLTDATVQSEDGSLVVDEVNDGTAAAADTVAGDAHAAEDAQAPAPATTPGDMSHLHARVEDASEDEDDAQTATQFATARLGDQISSAMNSPCLVTLFGKERTEKDDYGFEKSLPHTIKYDNDSTLALAAQIPINRQLSDDEESLMTDDQAVESAHDEVEKPDYTSQNELSSTNASSHADDDDDDDDESPSARRQRTMLAYMEARKQRYMADLKSRYEAARAEELIRPETFRLDNRPGQIGHARLRERVYRHKPEIESNPASGKIDGPTPEQNAASTEDKSTGRFSLSAVIFTILGFFFPGRPRPVLGGESQ